MSLSTQAQRLASLGADMRQSTYGENCQASYDGNTKVDAYWSSEVTTQQLLEAGFKNDHNNIVKIRKTALPIVLVGKTIELFKNNVSVSKVRVKEFGKSQFNVEWVLGCESLW